MGKSSHHFNVKSVARKGAKSTGRLAFSPTRSRPSTAPRVDNRGASLFSDGSGDDEEVYIKKKSNQSDVLNRSMPARLPSSSPPAKQQYSSYKNVKSKANSPNSRPKSANRPLSASVGHFNRSMINTSTYNIWSNDEIPIPDHLTGNTLESMLLDTVHAERRRLNQKCDPSAMTAQQERSYDEMMRDLEGISMHTHDVAKRYGLNDLTQRLADTELVDHARTAFPFDASLSTIPNLPDEE